ncbi:MAG: hypothetical protein DSM107014_12945 [Gomphosphaeria aponina SAG 52.96 = DSM 107014]|uniref:Uncharacterized protein n=1 Tax=Gomphosphaeria aponina SAG 52.96 = DSM 107014 TaxID=1521640 RepID=A0A941GS33_9CHRO|nr:hypothetical protein [Gomphosphaeria aponina SAG 52.96 = DSM 107014]
MDKNEVNKGINMDSLDEIKADILGMMEEGRLRDLFKQNINFVKLEFKSGVDFPILYLEFPNQSFSCLSTEIIDEFWEISTIVLRVKPILNIKYLGEKPLTIIYCDDEQQ